MKRASALVQNVMEILLDLRLPSEGPQRIMSPSGSMVVNRQLPDAEGNQPISDGDAEVTLPPLGNLLGNSISPNSTHVDIKVSIESSIGESFQTSLLTFCFISISY